MIALSITLHGSDGSSTKIQLPKFYTPAATGPFNLFSFLLGNKSGKTTEGLYTNIVGLDTHRDEKGQLRLTVEGGKDLAEKGLANKTEIFAADNYLKGTLVVLNITADNASSFKAPFDFSFRIKSDIKNPTILNTLEECIAPDSSLAEIDNGLKFVLKTKEPGVVVLFIGYPLKSSAKLNFFDPKTKLITKTDFKAGEELGSITKGNIYMCFLFNKETKIDPTIFMQ
jgi:hypothetical protein